VFNCIKGSISYAEFAYPSIVSDEIASGVLAEYGVQLLLDVASGLDIDVQHTVEKTLEHLTREREVPKKTRRSEDCKINDRFEVV
jgi:hypothetical protein